MTAPAIKIRETDDPANGSREVSCGICRRQTSSYTCPSCNLVYCSLNCFRSERHSQCSEKFYRREIETGIKSETSKTEGDKNKIVEFLKRIENQSATAEDRLFHQSDGEKEEDSLAQRFSAIDISSASTNDILRILTKNEKDKFFVALENPSSGLAQALLESAELEKTRRLPWWEAPCDSGESSSSPDIPYGAKPDVMVVPIGLINQDSRGVSLLYNISVVLLAYAYVTRHLAMSPLSLTTNDPQDRFEARKILKETLPFLTDRKSALLHMSLTDAVVSFWSRLDPGSVHNKAMPVLLGDVAKLARPRRITLVGESSGESTCTAVLTADHPFATAIMAISDLSSLFSTRVDSCAVLGPKGHIEMKLTFYAAHVLASPPSRLHALADELVLLSKSTGREILPHVV